MIKAVLDTNVIVSAFLNSEGAPGLLLDLALARHFRCFVSAPLLREYEEVLGRDQFDLKDRETARVLRQFQSVATLISPRKSLQLTIDPEDNIVLECAFEARANYLVTGNIRHFPPRFQDIRVIAPRQFLTVLASSLN